MLHLLTLVLFRIKLVCVAIVSCGTVNVAWLLEHTCRGPTLKRRSGTCPPSRHAKLSHSTKRWKRFLRTSARTSVNAAEQSSARVVSACPSKCKIHNPIWSTKNAHTYRTYCMRTCLPSLEQRTSKTIHGCIYLVEPTHTGLSIFPGPSGFIIARVAEGNLVGNSEGIRGNSMVVSGNSMDLVSAWSYKY